MYGRHSIFLNDIPPKIKITKLSRLRKTSLLHEFTSIFCTMFINKLQYIVMYSSSQFNSLFNEGRIVWLRLLLETQPLFKWHTLQLRKKIITTRVYVHFLPYWLINYSISLCILQDNSIPYSMRGESCGFDDFWRHSRLLNDISPIAKQNNYYTSLHAFFTILINKLQNTVMYSSRKFISQKRQYDFL